MTGSVVSSCIPGEVGCVYIPRALFGCPRDHVEPGEVISVDGVGGEVERFSSL